MKSIKVYIVDDNLLIRNGLKMELNKIPEVEVIGEAINGKDFLDSIEKNIPDLVFMDVHMPVLGGYQTTVEIVNKYPDIKVVAISMTCDQKLLYRMIDAGIKGYLLKNSGATEIRLCIENIMQNKNYFSCDLLNFLKRDVFGIQTDKNNIPNFTNRETQIFNYISKGYNTKQIAEALTLSPRTVEVHIANMKNKTGSSNILNLLIFGIKNSIVSI